MIELFAPEDARSQTLKEIRVEKQKIFVDEMKDFVNCIREDRAPLASADEGKKSLACVVAAYESMKTGKPVFLS